MDLEKAKELFKDIWSAVGDYRCASRDDRRFYMIAGAQWEGEYEDQYANRPRMEVNKVAGAVQDIIAEYRENRISLDFMGDGTEMSERLARLADGLYRADEERSGALEAYDTAFEEATAGGFGAWRFIENYEDGEYGDSDEQRVEIEPIQDADMRVFFDINARRQDKKDAKHCFVLTPMHKKTFEAEYGEGATTWPFDGERWHHHWTSSQTAQNICYVAELYHCVEEPEDVLVFEALDGSMVRHRARDFERDQTLQERLGATGHVLRNTRKSKRKIVNKYVFTGDEMVSGPERIAGDVIPVVPVFGRRAYIDNVEHFMGHVRLAKDAQRLKNMQVSKLAFQEASTPIEKPIVTPEQIVGHENMWARDAVDNYAYLMLNAVEDVNGNPVAMGPVGYTKPPQISPAMGALLQVAEQDMRDLLGNTDQGKEIESNVSGYAVELVHKRLEKGTVIYLSNFARAMKRGGEIWQAKANELYIENGRQMRTIGREGERSSATLMQPELDPATGQTIYANDMKAAKFDVVPAVGPSSEVKRAAVVKALTQLASMTQSPEDARVFTLKAYQYMDVDDGNGREWARKQLVNLGAMPPNEQEREALAAAAQQPDPQAELLMATAAESMAKAAKAEADIELIEAKTDETLEGIDQENRRIAIAAAEAGVKARQASERPTAQPNQ